MAVKSVSIRIEQEMLDKLGFVAEYEGRSLNSHIPVLIRDSIKAHEAPQPNRTESRARTPEPSAVPAFLRPQSR
jgi:hypothetical protein